MENRETLSPSMRVAVVLAGALQGVICYVITWYIEYAKLPSDTLWLMCVVPATVVMTTTLSLAMTSFRKPFLWLSLGMIGAAVAGMGGWLKWSVAGLDNWDTRNAVLLFGFHLLLMTLLLLPWLQRRLETAPTDAFYRDFNDKNWHNALTFLLVLSRMGCSGWCFSSGLSFLNSLASLFLIGFSLILTGLFQWRLAWFQPARQYLRVCRFG